MLIYNKITELVYDQFLILFCLEAIFILISIFVFKKKLNKKAILLSALTALLLSVLSLLFVNGNYGGMAYHERFGWPFEYYAVSRSIEDTIIPNYFHFDILKFLANSLYWIFIPSIVFLEIFNKKRSKKYLFFLIGSITVFILTTIFFSFSNTKKSTELIQQSSSITDADIAQIKKQALEKEYPEFKDFEKQSSFAGISVKMENQGNDTYFAYIVNGSGIPIAKATCFKVDRMLRVYKVGEFPDYLDSYIGYVDINPVTCTGIKSD